MTATAQTQDLETGIAYPEIGAESDSIEVGIAYPVALDGYTAPGMNGPRCKVIIPEQPLNGEIKRVKDLLTAKGEDLKMLEEAGKIHIVRCDDLKGFGRGWGGGPGIPVTPLSEADRICQFLNLNN